MRIQLLMMLWLQNVQANSAASPKELVYPIINVVILFSILLYQLIPSLKELFLNRKLEAQKSYEEFEQKKIEITKQFSEVEKELQELSRYQKKVEKETEFYIASQKRIFEETLQKEIKQLEWAFEHQIKNTENKLMHSVIETFFEQQNKDLRTKIEEKMSSLDQERFVVQKMKELEQ